VGKALQQDGVNAGIGGEHFEAEAGGGVALEYAGHVLAQQGEQAGAVIPANAGTQP
jgi:hypothetical protein